MTTAQKTCSPAGSDWNEEVVNLLIVLGSGHSVRVSGASSLMIYEGRELAAEVQLGEPVHVSVWLIFRIGSEGDSLDDSALRRKGESKLGALLPTWDVRGFARSDDEYLDRLNPDDPRVDFVARLDASRKSFDVAVELTKWALEQKRNFDAMEGADA